MKTMSNTFEIFHTYLTSANNDSDKQQLLDEWSERVLVRGDYSFEYGLLGLGWLIGFLIDNGHIEGDADEILEDIDDNVYKLTIKEVLDKNLNVEALLGYVTYYQQRLAYKSSDHFYRRFTHFECIKLILEKLNKFLLEIPAISKDIVQQKISVLLKYSYLLKTCVSESLVEEAFYHAIEELIETLEQSKNSDSYQKEIAMLHICVQQYEHPCWESQVRELADFSDSVEEWGLLARHYNTEKTELQELQEKYPEKVDGKLLFQWLTNVKNSHV